LKINNKSNIIKKVEILKKLKYYNNTNAA